MYRLGHRRCPLQSKTVTGFYALRGQKVVSSKEQINRLICAAALQKPQRADSRAHTGRWSLF